MRIHTYLRFEWRDGAYRLVRERGFDYSGPLARLDRGQSKQVAQQGMTQSAQDATNATTALGSTNTAVSGYQQRLNDFMRFGRQTYGANGEYMRDANTLGTTTAAAGSAGIRGNLTTNAMRTGANTANYADVAAESQRSADRDLTTQLAQADQNRLQQLTNINQYGVEAEKFPAEVQSQLYGTSTSGEAGNLNPAASAAKTPGFWDEFAPALVAGASQVGAGFAKACWIAEVLYGENDLRTHLLRAWLNDVYGETLVGGLVMKLYRRFGQRVARVLKQRTWLQAFFRPLFDHWLEQAEWSELERRRSKAW